MLFIRTIKQNLQSHSFWVFKFFPPALVLADLLNNRKLSTSIIPIVIVPVVVMYTGCNESRVNFLVLDAINLSLSLVPLSNVNDLL